VCAEICQDVYVTGFGSGDRTQAFLAKKFLSFSLDQSVIGSDDTLVECERSLPPDQAVWVSTPGAKPHQNVVGMSWCA